LYNNFVNNQYLNVKLNYIIFVKVLFNRISAQSYKIFIILDVIYKNVVTHLHKCRKGLGVIMQSSYKNSFKKLVLFKRTVFGTKLHIYKKNIVECMQMYTYIHLTSSAYSCCHY